MSIVIVSADDWVSVYKDGEKVWGNHSCPLNDGLEVLGIEFESHYIEDAEAKGFEGHETWEEVQALLG